MIRKSIAIIKTGSRTWQVAGLTHVLPADGDMVGEYVLTGAKHRSAAAALRYAVLLEAGAQQEEERRVRRERMGVN